MIRAVVEDDLEVDNGISGKEAALRGFDNALFDGGNVVPGNRAAEDFVDELEVSAARQRLHLDLAVAELAVAAALLLVAALHVGAPANRLAIGNFRRFQDSLRCGSGSSAWTTTTSMCCWPVPAMRNSLVCGVAEEAQHGIFFHQLVDAVAQLVFVGARLGLDGEGDGRLGKRDLRILDGRSFVAQRVAGQRVLAASQPRQCRRRAARSRERRSCPAWPKCARIFPGCCG